MKHPHFKHIILVLLLAIVIVPISLTQVTINDNRRPQQQETEKKTETTDHGSEAANKEANKETTSGENQSAAANKPANNQRANNSAVNAANNTTNYVDPKKPESLNQDFSTGSNSTNLQSHQEVEMRSYGYRILVYYTNKSKNAKANAQKRAKDITMKFPQYQFYFTYKAPTWRLRVGDFADEESAHRALKQLRQAFPMYSKEMTIIHDNINVWK